MRLPRGLALELRGNSRGGVEVISDSVARVIVIGKKKRKRKGPGNIIDEIVSEVTLSKACVLKQLCQLKKYSG